MPGGVAPKFGSEKVSRYTGVSQLQLRVSRYTVQLSCVFGLRNARPATGIQNSGTPKFLKKNRKFLLGTPSEFFFWRFSVFFEFFRRNLGSGTGEEFFRFSDEFRGSGVLDPCSWSGVSQCLGFFMHFEGQRCPKH